MPSVHEFQVQSQLPRAESGVLGDTELAKTGCTDGGWVAEPERSSRF